MIAANESCPQTGGTGYQMIRNINVENFRCYDRLEISKTARLNVIVGENGSGKTALLEAIFLALGRSPELGIRYRQQRGLAGAFAGPPNRIEEALWRALFKDGDWSKQLSVTLKGDGPESRSVRVFRGKQQLSIPLREADDSNPNIVAPITFTWHDYQGIQYSITPKLRHDSVEIEETGEENPDYHYFSSNHNPSASETASRFSALSRRGDTKKIVNMFTSEYPFVKDLSIEVEAGQPIVFAALKGMKDKLPLAYVSSGMNKIVSILVSIAASPKSVVLVDEIENGIYYKHLPSVCKMLHQVAKNNDAQLIFSTHSEEWLEALAATSEIKSEEIVLWRTVRNDQGHDVAVFSGDDLRAGVEYGSEVR